MGIFFVHILFIAAAAMPPAGCDQDTAVHWACWEGEEMQLTPEMRDDYEKKFAACTLNASRQATVESTITRMMKNRDRYMAVSTQTSVPWYVIALIHTMECDGRFDCHLHNGDPLAARTVNVPKGRPLTGKPPFGWEASAIDSLRFEHFDFWTDWSIAGTLYEFERYNGFGYRAHNVPTPYLWGGSQIYSSGKFVRDGAFDSKAMSSQTGAAVLLRRMLDQHLVELPNGNQSAADQPPNGGSK
jgi:lysozyme family protein